MMSYVHSNARHRTVVTNVFSSADCQGATLLRDATLDNTMGPSTKGTDPDERHGQHHPDGDDKSHIGFQSLPSDN
jgi:hypothetical protein